MIDSHTLNQMSYDLNIASCHCKVQSDLSFGLLQLVQQLNKRSKLTQNGIFFSCDAFIQIDQIQLELWNFECGDCVDDLLVELGDLLVFLHVAGFHQQTNLLLLYPIRLLFYAINRVLAEHIGISQSKDPINDLGNGILMALLGEDGKDGLEFISA